jgi:hypothetical protein
MPKTYSEGRNRDRGMGEFKYLAEIHCEHYWVKRGDAAAELVQDHEQ